MSDLISRNKAISVLEQLNEHSLNGKMDISNAIYLLENQKISYDVGKVISELEQNSVGITFPSHPDDEVQFIPIDRAIEIVKQGGVSDDVCKWKIEDEEANLYVTGCGQRHLIFEGTPKENGYRYCHYCGKKIKVVE